MNRNLRVCLLLTLAIGVVLIVLPFAMSMPSKTAAAQRLVDNLHPYMQRSSVDATVNDFHGTMVPLKPVAADAIAAAPEAPKLVAALASELHLTPARTEQFLSTHFPAVTGLLTGLPKLAPIFANVTPSIAHYGPLVDAIQDNVANYDKASSLPNLTLLTWFFVIPGVLLVILAGLPLLSDLRSGAGATDV